MENNFKNKKDSFFDTFFSNYDERSTNIDEISFEKEKSVKDSFVDTFSNYNEKSTNTNIGKVFSKEERSVEEIENDNYEGEFSETQIKKVEEIEKEYLQEKKINFKEFIEPKIDGFKFPKFPILDENFCYEDNSCVSTFNILLYKAYKIYKEMVDVVNNQVDMENISTETKHILKRGNSKDNMSFFLKKIETFWQYMNKTLFGEKVFDRNFKIICLLDELVTMDLNKLQDLRVGFEDKQIDVSIEKLKEKLHHLKNDHLFNFYNKNEQFEKFTEKFWHINPSFANCIPFKNEFGKEDDDSIPMLEKKFSFKTNMLDKLNKNEKNKQFEAIAKQFPLNNKRNTVNRLKREYKRNNSIIFELTNNNKIFSKNNDNIEFTKTL